MPYFLAASQFSIYKIDEKFILFAFFFFKSILEQNFN